VRGARCAVRGARCAVRGARCAVRGARCAVATGGGRSLSLVDGRHAWPRLR